MLEYQTVCVVVGLAEVDGRVVLLPGAVDVADDLTQKERLASGQAVDDGLYLRDRLHGAGRVPAGVADGLAGVTHRGTTSTNATSFVFTT